MNLLITGGCGFIGSNFIEMVLDKKSEVVNKVVNLDALTYAGNLANTEGFDRSDKYIFENIDLRDFEQLCDMLDTHNITHIIHIAAETHVDNSISDPDVFIDSNIIGTYNLLKAAKKFNIKKLHHVSTDEVYGELGATGKFNEQTPYNPNNPYSASKAASDFLVRAYYHTYGLPVTISNCSNNYGPRQHSEKFIPTIIESVMDGKKIPIYGEGLNVRDWIYVKDHCEGLWSVFECGDLGQTYCIGAGCEKKNIEVVTTVCDALGVDAHNYISYVADRPGHDFRYAIDSTKIQQDLDWAPRHTFEEGIQTTVRWYYEKN